MSSGLSRRRGGANRAEQNSSHSDENAVSISQSTDDLPNNHKIAYDPHDLMNQSQEKKFPFLTLMEEVLLIGLKDKEGYLSFWNDNISYALRGLIILELAFRGKIRMINDPARRRFDLPDRLIECVDGSLTGETLLDEALKLIKNDDTNSSVSSWIDLLSGETWNLMKINYQLKQVRERLSKGLVDKGVLKTERKNFFLFDMPTHPINDPTAKKNIVQRLLNILINRNFIIEYDEKYFQQQTSFKYLRSIALVSGCCAANVLENILTDLNFDTRDKAFLRVDEILAEYGDYPFQSNREGSNTTSSGVGVNLMNEVNAEIQSEGINELTLEVIAAVINIFGKMDSII